MLSWLQSTPPGRLPPSSRRPGPVSRILTEKPEAGTLIEEEENKENIEAAQEQSKNQDDTIEGMSVIEQVSIAGL